MYSLGDDDEEEEDEEPFVENYTIQQSENDPTSSSSPSSQLGKSGASGLISILFGKEIKGRKAFPEEWQQGLFFNKPNRKNILQYGLVQVKVTTKHPIIQPTTL